MGVVKIRRACFTSFLAAKIPTQNVGSKGCTYIMGIKLCRESHLGEDATKRRDNSQRKEPSRKVDPDYRHGERLTGKV